jgi:DDE family transposase
VDGRTVSMPDTPSNQREFPQPRTQKPGLGFPLARIVVPFSVTVGTARDVVRGRYQGNQTGETALFRSLHDQLEADDLLLADRYYSSYWEFAFIQQRGADLISRLHQQRRADCRRGRRLGKDDHVVSWSKPSRPDWMAAATSDSLPTTLTMREVRVRVRHPGFRTRVLVVVTTLTDTAELPREELALRYRLRW